MSEPTARERALRLVRLHTLPQAHAIADAIEAEIVAAERAAVEAFALWLALRSRPPGLAREQVAAWLREREGAK